MPFYGSVLRHILQVQAQQSQVLAQILSALNGAAVSPELTKLSAQTQNVLNEALKLEVQVTPPSSAVKTTPIK